ncbi:hypothetical protein HBA55_31970 [Pseudomaricurvus alkylphenolicus]|jgi:stearoyl-CoA desaturase (delta-9 desaturase)|uniref:hypothetical protein n=1 Tax=Pseudomaricurvus alkylphenolicus TaxID=1306991 RepID=UPI0014210F62|nr:hypothetical protein [Pseudomaricurvus alkylphenolicus]NIB44261.1 hypothetical protein [Pseudomaricurvus alkylphenolicus]
MTRPQNDPAPIYHRIRDLFSNGFTIDWVTASFISSTHLICLLATPVAYYYAPAGFWQIMLGWTLIHALIGCLSTTVYSHRLIAHGAAKTISWPVHIVFGFIGQVLAMQGSVRRWAAMHVVHHGVDRSGKHHLDPYSATWFSSGWRNFLWSHVLTYFFHHPDTEAKDKAYDAKNSAPLVWQDKLYLPLLIGLNFLLPMVVGYLITGTITGALCLLVASIGGFILAQHNTWTVNSVTHMWGFTKGAFSSAKNNYIWMGPLGEGNHHADHHDYGRDYRNGFGWSGWLLDPSRYVILLLNALGLVKGLQRASKRQEAEIIARRKLLEARVETLRPRWDKWEAKLEALKSEWLEATQHWETFRARKIQIQSMSLPQLELKRRLEQLKAEMEVARRAMRARKQAFFDAIYEMRAMQYA